MNRKHTKKLFYVLTLVVILAAGSWFAGSTIQSPAEAAARTAPPTPSPILVPVEERVLSTNIVTRGTVRFGSPHAISIAPSTLKADTGVITTLPARNSQLAEGNVLLTASDRPVFILEGSIPTFRDLIPGLAGADVLQLENGLERLGFDPGPVDGIYDQQTSTAVVHWYNANDWQPFAATTEQVNTIRSLEQELAQALNNKLAATDAAAAAPRVLTAVQAEVAAANLAAAAEMAAANTTTERELAQARATAAQLAGEVAIQEALDAQMAVERESLAAAALVDQLAADLEIEQRAAAVKVPADEIVFLPALPVRIEEIEAAIGDSASGQVLTVTNNQLAVDSSLPLAEALLVQPGMFVAIDEPELGLEASGVVARVADTPGSDGVDGFHIYFETLVQEAATSLEGFSLRLTIAVESTGGKVTAVPLSALSLAADGSSRVQVKKNGVLAFVVVEPGLVADGFVEVTPINGELKPGQLVVIGFDNG